MTKSAVEKLKADSRVNYIELDRIMTLPIEPNSHNNKRPGGGGNTPQEPPQTTPWGITEIGAPVNATDKTVWIIDTGIDTYFNNIELNIDLSRSTSFVQRGKYTFQDGNGHGTHVAGIIAAKNNSIDVVGVASGATIVAIRVLDNSGAGYYSWVIAGVDYVAANAASGNVANMSLGGPYDKALNDAVIAAAKKGIKFAIAAGNDGQPASNYSPASAYVSNNNIYTVSAYGDPDLFAWWSNYGDGNNFYSCPGVSILSLKKGGGTTTMSGTSMAAPHLAGLLLLGWTNNSIGTVQNDLDEHADPMAHL
jgi:subtilisin family serine protease